MTDRIAIWTDEFLENMRLEGDPLADETIKSAFQHNQVDIFNQIMRSVKNNSDNIPDNADENLKYYFAESRKFPDWFEPERYARVQALYHEYEVPIMASLLFAGLPMCYGMKKEAYVLTQTYRLTHHAHRRSLETMQMVIDLMKPNALEPDGRGIATIQKVRLLHAGTRYLLMQNDWDVDYYGVPANQEDLAGTQEIFAYIIPTKLPLLGVFMEDEQIEDYIHTWRFIGYLLGIREELLAQSFAEAEFLTNKIQERQMAHSEDGEQLVQALIDMVRSYLPPKPKNTVPDAMIRYLCGDKIGDILGIEQNIWSKAFSQYQWARLSMSSNEKMQTAAHKGAELLIRNIFDKMVIEQAERQNASFSVPNRLTQTWTVDDLKDDKV